MSPVLSCTMFAEQQENVLMSALEMCAVEYAQWQGVYDNKKPAGDYIYDYIAQTPKTSLVVELGIKVNELGYEIGIKEKKG